MGEMHLAWYVICAGAFSLIVEIFMICISLYFASAWRKALRLSEESKQVMERSLTSLDERLSALTRAESSIKEISKEVQSAIPRIRDEIIPKVQEKLHEALKNGSSELEKSVLRLVDDAVGKMF